MTDRDAKSREAEEARVRDAVRSLERPRAGASFRERLKADFVAGRLSGRGTPGPSRRRWRVVAIGATTLAAAGVAIVLTSVDRTEPWIVVPERADGTILVDGRPIPTGNAEAIARALRPGVRIATEQGTQVEFASEGQMVLQATPGTEFTLPAPPARRRNREIRTHVLGGELRVTTGVGFRGARLTVLTDEATIEVTGTTLAVIRGPDSTCVCVFEGVVQASPRGGAVAPIPAGTQQYFFADGRPTEVHDINDMERAKLGMFRDQYRSALDPAEEKTE